MAILRIQLTDGTLLELTRGAAERLVKEGKAIYFAGGAVEKAATPEVKTEVGEAVVDAPKRSRKRGGE